MFLFTIFPTGSIVRKINHNDERKYTMDKQNERNTGLYNKSFEHDNCGIGAIVNIKGVKTHKTVENALSIVENLEHRAGKDAEGKPVMAWVFSFRFPINFLKRQLRTLELI